ncbi:hypothetical protein [Photorhabdus sp. RM71S]|uniref:hypothetical protein n=1 Tax=Photorhabdus sp. RM71S TaxID=3342824 RepID=UPI0036D79589
MGPSWRPENGRQTAAILGGAVCKLGQTEKDCSGHLTIKPSYRSDASHTDNH